MGLLKSYLAVKLKFKKPLHTKERWEEGILYYMILAYQAISFFLTFSMLFFIQQLLWICCSSSRYCYNNYNALMSHSGESNKYYRLQK